MQKEQFFNLVHLGYKRNSFCQFMYQGVVELIGFPGMQ